MTDVKKVEAVEEDLFDSESTGGSLFKLENIGDKIEGLMVGRKEGKTKTGPATFYTIQSGNEEKTFIPTKALQDEIDKYLRLYGGLNKTIFSIELMELKPGNFASPFKVFKTRAGIATEARLAALGINSFDSDVVTSEDEIPH